MHQGATVPLAVKFLQTALFRNFVEFSVNSKPFWHPNFSNTGSNDLKFLWKLHSVEFYQSIDHSIVFVALEHLPKTIFGRFWPPLPPCLKGLFMSWLSKDRRYIYGIWVRFFSDQYCKNALSVKSDDKWLLSVSVRQIICLICFISILTFLACFGTFFQL